MRTTKYTEDDLREAVKKSLSISDVCREIGIKPKGGNSNAIRDKLIKFGIDTSHFTGRGWNVGLKFRPMKSISTEELLCVDITYSSSKLRNRLLKEGYKEYVCEHCGLSEWMGVPIPLELHHINGIHTDNRLENLEILCSNCHSLTENFGSKNKPL